jgi:hypothetical protein
LSQKDGWEELNATKLKRSLFSDDLWKLSRNYIKKSLGGWLDKWNVVILEDDLLLKSQRKQMRQLVEHSNIRYLELYRPVGLEECMINLKQRQNQLSEEYHLPILKARECY